MAFAYPSWVSSAERPVPRVLVRDRPNVFRGIAFVLECRLARAEARRTGVLLFLPPSGRQEAVTLVRSSVLFGVTLTLLRRSDHTDCCAWYQSGMIVIFSARTFSAAW